LILHELEARCMIVEIELWLDDYLCYLSRYSKLLMIVDVATIEAILFTFDCKRIQITEVIMNKNNLNLLAITIGNDDLSLLINRIVLILNPQPCFLPLANVLILIDYRQQRPTV